METITIAIDDKKFDEAVHGAPDGPPSLPEGGDVAIFIKKRAMVSGKSGAVITFTIQLPNGTMRRAQAVVSVTNLINALCAIKGWREAGLLEE